jgi:cobalamin biosynthesis Mg chelatase CobN
MLDRPHHRIHTLPFAIGLLEAHGRGYWDANPKILDQLREIVSALEDQLEGVA